MRRLAIALALGAALSAPALADDDTALLTANGFLNRGLYELAIPEYEKFLSEHEADPNAPTARYGLAVCLYRLGRHADALARLEEIETEGFGFAAEVELLRGHCALATGDPARAAAALESLLRAHEDHPSAPDAAALLIEARYRGGEFAEAIEAADDLRQRWGQSPARERAELFAGMTLMAQRQWKAAADRLEQAREAFPAGALANQFTLLAAQSRHQAGETRPARRAYEQVFGQGDAQQKAAAALGLAQIVRAAGEHEKAAELLDALLRGGSESEIGQLASLERARVWFDQEDYRRAKEMLAALAPKARADLRDDIAYWSAKCALREGDALGAADALAKALAEYPQSELVPEMLYDRAVALSRAGSGEADGAFEAFLAGRAEHPQAPAALHALIAAAHGRAEYERSVDLAEQFLRDRAEHPLAPEVALLWAEGQYLRGRHDEALAGYDRALAMNLDAERARQAAFRRAMTLHRLGRADEARPGLEEAAARAQEEALYRPALLALGDDAFAREEWAQSAARMRSFLALGLDQPGADDAMIKLGLAQLRQEDLEQAQEAFASLLERWPDSPHAEQARFELGQAHVTAQRDADARPLLLKVAEAPDSRFAPWAMNHLGAIAQRAGDNAEAVQWFERAAAAGDEALKLEAGFGRARALLAEGRHVEAAAAFDAVATGATDVGQIAAARASAIIALSRAGRHEEAVGRFEKLDQKTVARLEPRLKSSLHYERAWSLRQLGRDEAAAAAYAALLADTPDPALAPYAALDLASIHREAERWQEAIALLEPVVAAAEAAPEEAPFPADALEQARYQLGACALELGDHAGVARWLSSFAADFPGSELAPSADLLCAEALMKSGRSADAVEHLERAVAADAGDDVTGPALLRLGEAQSSLQRWRASEEAFAAYLERFDESELWFQARFGVGFARENQGRLDEAIEAYRPVAEGHSGPTAARAQFQIGECLFAQKQHEAAVRELLKTDILHAEPEWSAAALYEAGRCFEAMDKPAQARVQYEQVISRFGEMRWAELASARLEALGAG